MKKLIFILITAILFSCNVKKQKNVVIKQDTIFEEDINARNEFYLKQRLDEKGNFNLIKILPVKDSIKKIKQVKALTGTQSTNISNYNFAGRIRSLVWSNGNMLAGSVSGGIFKSVNNGQSWFPVNDYLANLAISCMIVDPVNQNIIYTGTGEGFGNYGAIPGLGIFKSTDGGNNFTQLASTNNSNFKYVNRIAINPQSTNIIYAGGNNKVYKSTDYGNSWTALNLSVSGYVVDVKINPNKPNTIVVGSFFDSYISQDAGLTWLRLTDGLIGHLPLGSSSGYAGRSEFAFSRNFPNYIGCAVSKSYGQYWVSRNNGLTWYLKNTGQRILGGQSWYDNSIWISPVDTNLIVIGGDNLWRSTNAGTTFAKINHMSYQYSTGTNFSPHADFHAIVNTPDYNGTTNKKVFVCNDGGIATTNDITTVMPTSGWVNCNSGLNTLQFYKGGVSLDGNKIGGGTQDNGTPVIDMLLSIIKEWISGDGGYFAINPKNSNIWYGEVTYLSMLKTTNGGKQFFSCTNGLTDANDYNNCLFIAPFILPDSNTLYAGGSSLWRSLDGANTWQKLRLKNSLYRNISAIAVSKSNPKFIYIGYETGMVSKSIDGGLNWVDINIGLPKTFCTSIDVSPSNPNIIIASFGGYSNKHIYKSTNGGLSWVDINYNLPAIQINKVRFHFIPIVNRIYVGTDAGLFTLASNSTTWVLDSTIPHVPVTDIQFSNNNAFIFTYGRGIFKQGL